MQHPRPLGNLTMYWADEGANTLIFPNLSAANIAYNLMREAAGPRSVGFDATGPILLDMCKPVYVLQLGSSEHEIVNMVSIAVVEAQGVG